MHFHFLYLRYFYGRKQNFLNLDWDLSVLFSFENVLISKQLPFYMHFSLDNEYFILTDVITSYMHYAMLYKVLEI